jgi:peptidoglycan/LPS O-acetylase OafA/YrhL
VKLYYRAPLIVFALRIVVLKYRAEIDGLRALAVVPVIAFHAGFGLFSGGFVGVDVFFVISGYLITTILIDDIENERSL